jgi:hypothetical protein
MTTQPATNPAHGGLDFESLAVHRDVISFVLLGLGAALLAVPIVNGILYGWQAAPVIVWGAALSLALLLTGLLYLTLSPSGRITEGDRLRVVALTTLVVSGVVTTVLGLVLPFTAAYHAVLGGGLTQWRENWPVLLKIGLPLFGGLVLMFLGTQLARNFERSQAVMRRILYGYNTVLSTLLLLTILLLVNILGYVGLPPFSALSQPIDWTATRNYSLSEPMKTFLTTGLKKPVKVYAILYDRRQQGPVTDLLSLCKGVAGDRFQYEVLLRDFNSKAIDALLRKYTIPPSAPFGLLVVAGSGDDAPSDFIKEDDLFEIPPMQAPPGTQPAFTGERALLRSLIYLNEGKTKAKVYFTQGNGEPSVSDPGPGGLSQLFGLLGSANFEPQPFEWKLGVTSFPADADLLVIARPNPPTGRLPDEFLKAVRDYLKGEGRKAPGKLVVLTDVIRQEGKQMTVTGLEALLLSDYGVRINNDHVLALAGVKGDPRRLRVAVNPRNPTPLARAFATDEEGNPIIFTMFDVRTVEPASDQAKPNLQVDPLMMVFIQQGIWSEKDLTKDPAALASDLRKPENLNEAKKLISREPLSVAVTVSEGRPNLPREGHEGLQTPRMVVFGDTTWLTNEVLESNDARINYSLFSSALSWLRERGSYGPQPQIEGKTQRTYETKITSFGQFLNVVLLPGVVMLFGIMALGGAVWLVRRR